MPNTIRIAILIGLFLRLFVAMWNSFYGPSFGAEVDAAGFHLIALENAQNPTLDDFPPGWIYAYVLSLVYYWTTDSLFLGSVLSCFAWLASAALLLKIMRLLSIDKSQQSKAMLIYALLPSSILYTSVTLREAYQLLFVNLAVYSTFKIYLNKSSKHWLVLFCAVIGMGVLHGALFAFGLFIVVATLALLNMFGLKKPSLVKLAFAVPLIALFVFYGLSLFTSFSYKLDDGLGIAIEKYQEGSLSVDARAHYKDSVEISGVVGLLTFIPIAILQYLFEPMPWRISSATDIGLMFENILRAWLIWKAWTGLRNIPVPGRRPVLFVFLSYLILETIWSLGTVNWGTAVRHHIPSMGLLLIAAFAYARTAFKRGSAIAPVR
jgi:hypothetical protein